MYPWSLSINRLREKKTSPPTPSLSRFQSLSSPFSISPLSFFMGEEARKALGGAPLVRFCSYILCWYGYKVSIALSPKYVDSCEYTHCSVALPKDSRAIWPYVRSELGVWTRCQSSSFYYALDLPSFNISLTMVSSPMTSSNGHWRVNNGQCHQLRHASRSFQVRHGKLW